jgi:hypothetical protein
VEVAHASLWPFGFTTLKPASNASTFHGGGNRRIGRDYMKGAPTEADARFAVSQVPKS